MPEENTVIGNVKAVEAGDVFGIKADDSPWAVPFQFQDFYNDKAIKKFINSVERLVRTSREYKVYIELLRTNVHQLNHDNILSNITTADVDLEFHHYPFTLYEIVEVIMLDHIANDVKFTSFSLAKEIMELHYKHFIGIVPLTKTTHELAHSGNLFISTNQIFGEYKKFMELYPAGISVDLKDKIKKLEEYTSKGIPSDFKGLLK